MPPLVIAGIAFGLSQVMLSMLLLWRKPDWALPEQLYMLLLCAVSAYLLSPVLADTILALLMTSSATAVPGLFWLFSSSVFSDRFRLQAWQVGLVLITVLLPMLGNLLHVSGGYAVVLISLPQLLEFVLLGLTLWVVARHWQVDLVESRRRMRWWFVAVNGVYIFALILMRELIFNSENDFAQWQYASVGAVLLLTNTLLLQYTLPSLFAVPAGELADTDPGAGAVADSPQARVDPELVEALQQLMDKAAVYRRMGLTLGQLAEQLDIPQYRLRQTINGALGFRNFSDFLNSYRIAEAAQRLADPEQDLPVLTIAMDAGFRSLSSFNKAFKDIQGVTPTTYRKAAR